MLNEVLPEELIGNSREIQPLDMFRESYASRNLLRKELHRIEEKYKSLRAEFANLYLAKKKIAKYHQVHSELKQTLNKLIELDRELLRSQIKI